MPDQMPQITPSQVQEDQVSLSWTSLSGTSTGNSEITAYALYFDDATGSITHLLQSTTGTSFTATGLTGGQNYQFHVKACNIYGCGLASDAITVRTSDVPDQIDTLTTSIEGTDVKVAWLEPDANFEPILEYEVVFEASNDAYVTDSTNCDGQDPSVTECLIPMDQMISLTGLSQGALIVARVRARNANGWALLSQENIAGALIEVVPHKVETVAFDVDASTNS